MHMIADDWWVLECQLNWNVKIYNDA